MRSARRGHISGNRKSGGTYKGDGKIRIRGIG